MAKVIDLGLLPPDDPVYSRGLIVKGKRFRGSKQKTPGEKKSTDNEQSQQSNSSANNKGG